MYRCPNQALKRSDGALAACASVTRAIIRATVLSSTVLVTATSSTPSRLTVASKTWAPGCFATGIDSPVMFASSREPRPLTIVPSAGTRAPGRSTTTSSTLRLAAGTSETVPSEALRNAVSGRNSINASMARRARPSARSSSVVEILNSVSRTAPSKGAPTAAAATAATTISRSMSRMRSSHRVTAARNAAGSPPVR